MQTGGHCVSSCTFAVGCFGASVSLGQPGFHPGASGLASQGSGSTVTTPTLRTRAKSSCLKLFPRNMGTAPLCTWALGRVKPCVYLLCMFSQTGRCAVSDARVTSTVLPSLCSGVCFKSDSCGTMGFVWFRSSWTVSFLS